MSNQSCSNCTLGPSSNKELLGWVWDNPGRGTTSLITTCLATIFLCTWVVIHPRVYKRESYANLHKVALFFKTIFAPEFIAVEGLQEWAQCRRMQRECADFAAGQFKLVHAFYISMLALRYQTPNGDRVVWPNQYTWLLQQGLIRWEDHPNWGLALDDIYDKSKSDNATKLLALMQVIWFTAQCILRISYHLPLSQLESMTLGYIPLFIVTYFFWWNKPKDIRSPSLVVLPEMSLEQFHFFESMAVSNKFDNEGMKEQTSYWNIWYLTPRVFEKVEEDRLIHIRDPPRMTWFKDLNIPETFGFMRNQVTPFSIKTPDGERLYAWHILPVELYRKHQIPLIEEPVGFVSDIKSRLGFQLLREDPDARLILHMHGAGGTVASGYRVPNYRALSAGNPRKIHVLTFDYRGFGRSTGSPSETGLVIDALAVVDWAMDVAGIPPSRILIFGQSMGTAVSIAVSKHLAVQNPPIVFAGTVLVAPFVDVATLVSTYRVAGTVPILSPVAKFPFLFKYLQRFIRDQWMSKDCIAQYIRANEMNGEKYRITIIHAEDDFDIPWHHSQLLFWHAVNASMPSGISYDEQRKLDSKADLGAAGSIMEWKTGNGVIREEILKTGLHDVIMGYPVVTMAVMRFFEAADPSFTP